MDDKLDKMATLDEMATMAQINELREYLKKAKEETIPTIEDSQKQNADDITAINEAIASLAEIVGGE